MALWNALIQSLNRDGVEEHQPSTMINNVARPATSHYSKPNRSQEALTNFGSTFEPHASVDASAPRLDEILFHQGAGVESSTKEGQPQRAEPARVVESEIDSGRASPVVGRTELQESIMVFINEMLISRLRTERIKTIHGIVNYLLPRIERAAAEAAEREVNKLIEDAQGESVPEKIQAILGRAQELPDDALETLFLRRSAMTDALKRLLHKIQLEDADNEWEDLGRGR
ncbi:hypothetical protein F5Y19DRAFT_493478 [Xylariaceae sp. FL1651]|nr:hypothetical protein F5Y19DRAFT_493478 [Xylariaceae sp. FL1651]